MKRWKNETGGYIVVRGVGEVADGEKFETDLPIKHRGVVPVMVKKPKKEAE